MKTALIHHPIFQKHDTGEGHPETSKRYEAIMDALQSNKEFYESLTTLEAEKVSKGIIQAAHTPEHFKRVEGAFENGVERLDADTVVSLHSFEAAIYGAGGACRAVDAVMR
ncbi:MAG: histone deacetylase family protein, partial [Acidobacteria bacterium]|nr:histone deacetylase family protein [Acidobacteriota bacterium]